jgi:hypothetical protein
MPTTPGAIPVCHPFGGTVPESHARADRIPPAEPTEESAIATLAETPVLREDAATSRRLRDRLGAVPRPAERWAIALLLLWLLVGPRIELGLLGLRLEDVVFGVLALLCLLHVGRVRRPSGPTIAIAAVAAAGVLSAVVASARGMVDPVTSMLYAVRPLEYWIAFPATLLLLSGPLTAVWSKRMDLLLVVVTVLQTLFAVLQYYFALPVGFSHAAYTRAAGLTVGPYELGAISAALVVYWVAHGRFTMASLAVIALAASISRISILGAGIALAVLVVAWIVHVVRRVRPDGLLTATGLRGRSRLALAGQALSVVAAGLVLGFTIGVIQVPTIELPQAPVAEEPAAPAPPSDEPTSEAPTEEPPAPVEQAGPQAPEDSIATRLASTSVLGSWNAAGDIADLVPPVRSAQEYAFAAYSGMNVYLNANTMADRGVEASNLVRFYRWHLILKTIDDPADVIFGLGPSFVGPSVDGSYLRFYADGGVLGLLAWAALIVVWLRRPPLWMVCATLTLLVGALFIDIVYAQRPMVLYWMLLALAAARLPRKRKAEEAVEA